MRRLSRVQIAAIGAVTMLQLFACYQQSAAETPTTVVATVEPDSGDLGYRVSLGEVKLRTSGSMLDGLSRGSYVGDRLAVLFDARVPVSSIAHIASVASKVGYFGDNLKLLLLDEDRTGMTELSLPRTEWVTYSNDPKVVGELFR
jgi:hypothetical protein